MPDDSPFPRAPSFPRPSGGEPYRSPARPSPAELAAEIVVRPVVTRPAPPVPQPDPHRKVIPGSKREAQLDELLAVKGNPAPKPVPLWQRYPRLVGALAFALGVSVLASDISWMASGGVRWISTRVLHRAILRGFVPFAVLCGAWLLLLGIRRAPEGHVPAWWKLGLLTMAACGGLLGIAYAYGFNLWVEHHTVLVWF